MEIKKQMTGKRSASKQDVIKAVRKARKDVQWPKAKALHEHVADAVGALLTGIKLYGRGND
jgi:Holliday junction resolvasome RuvABC endonuclease subunit